MYSIPDSLVVDIANKVAKVTIEAVKEQLAEKPKKSAQLMVFAVKTTQITLSMVGRHRETKTTHVLARSETEVRRKLGKFMSFDSIERVCNIDLEIVE